MTPSLRQKALDFLSRREHSRLELATKLKRYEVTTAEIELLLDKLETQKLLSDTRFADAYCHMRFKKGYGPQRIAQELEVRGVADTIISGILNKISEIEWQENLKAVREKKFGQEIPKDLADKFKQNQFLYYRGFTGDQIKAI
jgi:regulatory protein